MRPSPPPAVPADAPGDDDATYRGGTARAALAHREFRVVWTGSFASNIGTWMQNVTQGAFAYRLTGSPTYVGLLVFAQLGPMLVLSLVGGLVADSFDRRRFLMAVQAEQMVFSFVLAWLARGEPSRVALFAVVMAVGVGNALNAPAWVSTVPALVPRRDLPGAISLNSAMVNGSRVIGPAIAGVAYPAVGASGVFAVNAVTYLFVVAALWMVRLPALTGGPAGGEGTWRRLTAGFRVARHDPLVGRVLVTIAVFSFFCLPFLGQFPVIAERNLGMDTKTLAYGLLYAAFGLGACLGALSIGTVLAGADKRVVARRGLAGFAVALAVLAVLRHPAPAYPAAFVLGLFYFGTTTALLTVLQSSLDDRVRGRVMALWLMGFGGTVPLGNLLAGPLVDGVSATAVLLVGAVVAVALAARCDLVGAARRRPAAGTA